MGSLRRHKRKLGLDRTLEEQVAKLPNTDAQAMRELVHEQMKLGYIRDVKLRRHRTAAWLIILWGLFSLASSLLYHCAIW